MRTEEKIAASRAGMAARLDFGSAAPSIAAINFRAPIPAWNPQPHEPKQLIPIQNPPKTQQKTHRNPAWNPGNSLGWRRKSGIPGSRGTVSSTALYDLAVPARPNPLYIE